MDEIPWLDRRELAAWVRVAALLELLPGVLDRQLRRDADLMTFEYSAALPAEPARHPTPGSPTTA